MIAQRDVERRLLRECWSTSGTRSNGCKQPGLQELVLKEAVLGSRTGAIANARDFRGELNALKSTERLLEVLSRNLEARPFNTIGLSE